MSLSDYTRKITSEHSAQPEFMAAVSALLQPFVDGIGTVAAMPTSFDLDQAIGAQLDVLGLWIGISRTLRIPLTGVYFSFDVHPGLDEGTFFTPFDDTTQLTTLDDTTYRKLLKVKIGNNHWDGTIPGAYAFLNPILGNDNTVIQDNGDMSMLLGVIGAEPLDAVTTALLENGYLDAKPVGVRITDYVTPSVPGDPFFGFDVENSTISGLDVGAWATLTPGR